MLESAFSIFGNHVTQKDECDLFLIFALHHDLGILRFTTCYCIPYLLQNVCASDSADHGERLHSSLCRFADKIDAR